MQRESSLSILNEPKTTKGPRQFGPIFSLFVGVPLLMIGAAVSIPVGLIGLRVDEYRRKRFGGRMSSIARTITFDEFRKAVHDGTGTVICECRGDFKGPA